MTDFRKVIETEHVLESALGVAEGRYAPMYERAEYEDAMLAISKREARAGESTAVAFARLCEERDHRVESLFVAGRLAEMQEVRKASDDRRTAIETGRLGEDIRKQHESRQSVMAKMEAHAASNKLDGESEEQAFARLLETDEAMRGMYAKYRE